MVGTKGLAGQVIDILIDNALRHGDGAVTLMIDGPSVVVIDQGKGMPLTTGCGPCSTGRSTRPPSTAGAWRSPAGWRRSTAPSLDVVGNQPLRIRFRLVRGDHERR